MSEARITAKHTPTELAAFDKQSLEARQMTYCKLGHEKFVLMYGKERIPHQELKPKLGDGMYKDGNPKYPDGNPKTQFGIAKPDVWAIDPIAIYVEGMAMMQGMLKYGLFNYYDDPVSASTYVNAAQRHLDLYRLGQDLASDTGVEHLGHLRACCNILISAHYHGRLIDDRTKNIQMAEDLERFFQEKQPLIKRIREEWTGFAEKLKEKRDAE